MAERRGLDPHAPKRTIGFRSRAGDPFRLPLQYLCFKNSGGQRRARSAAPARSLRFQRRPAASSNRILPIHCPNWRITEVLILSATKAPICFQGSAGTPVRFVIRDDGRMELRPDPGRRPSQQPPATQAKILTHLCLSFRHHSELMPCHCSSSESQ